MADTSSEMEEVREQLRRVFVELDKRVCAMNHDRREHGLLAISKARAQILGQISLLVHKKASILLSLAQTADIDAYLAMDHIVKVELRKILRAEGWVYDEDSYLIWIPPGAKFETLFDLENILVESIDPESALVSKAVKAPEKNKPLIREAIASEAFPALVDRILKNGGKLEDFL